MVLLDIWQQKHWFNTLWSNNNIFASLWKETTGILGVHYGMFGLVVLNHFINSGEILVSEKSMGYLLKDSMDLGFHT